MNETLVEVSSSIFSFVLVLHTTAQINGDSKLIISHPFFQQRILRTNKSSYLFNFLDVDLVGDDNLKFVGGYK